MDNIIKIYLRQTGGIAELYKTIPLYVGMYNTAILDVYVPTTLIGENTSVKVGAILTANDGTKATTDSLPMTYKETTTYRQVEYNVYELNPFPANFLTYAGKQSIVVNVVNLENEEVESVVTTQIANIDVLDSSLIPDEELSTTAVDIFNARISTNEQNIATNTENITSNTTQIGANTLNIAQNTQDIEQIKETMSTGENYVGSLTVQTLDDITSELNDLVETIEGRSALNGDVVIVILVVSGGTDVSYKYFYTNSGWQSYQIPAIESASNTDKGLIQGTLGQARNTQVDITGGQINNIYVRDSQGNLRDIQEYQNTIKTTQDNIISGTTKVGYAEKADKDSSGNTFETTYLTQNAGVSKQQMKDYALPREFNDIYYLGQNVFQNTKPSAAISYSQTIEGIGTYELLDAELQTTASFELSYKNSYQNVFYISSSQDVVCQFRLDTSYGDNVLMNTELSNQMVMTANNVYRVQFNDNFNELSDAVSFDNGNPTISQVLSVVSTDSVQKTFTVWSNSTNLSTFNLNTNNYLIRLEQGHLGEIPAITLGGTLNNNIATFEVGEELENNTIVKFTLSCIGLDSTTNLQLVDAQTSEEFYLITPYNEGQVGAEVDRPSVADFSQTKVTTNGNVTTITFLALVDKIEGYGTKLFVNEDDLSEIKQAYSELEEAVTQISGLLENKQDTLTSANAGDNVTIQTINNVLKISAQPGVPEITQATNMWELSNGIYKGTLNNFYYKTGQSITETNIADGIVMITRTDTKVCFYAIYNEGLMTGIAGADNGSISSAYFFYNLLKQSDVINNLTSTVTNKPLSAAQGKALNDNKQNKLTTSQQNAVDSGITSTLVEKITTNETAISIINSKIPNEASSTNQLADKNYVSDVINQFSAYYITKNAQGDPFSTKAELTNATVFYSGGSVRVPTTNDYCIVLADESKQSSTGVDPTTRYSYQGNQWEYQYTINDTPLTAAQLAAINSGITSTLVGQISTNTTNIANKVPTYASGSSSWDTTPTANSTKPVTSGGIKTALDGKQDTMTELTAAEVDTIFDNN